MNLKLNTKYLIETYTLIIGDVGVGKTLLTSKIIKNLIKAGFASKITIIDLGPKKNSNIGGKLSDFINTSQLRYLTLKKIYKPRTEGRNKEEVLALVKKNIKNITPLFEKYREKPTKILVVNDISLYLQGERVEKLLYYIKPAKTFIGNSYYGTATFNDKQSGINQTERYRVKKFIKNMDIVIYITKGEEIEVI